MIKMASSRRLFQKEIEEAQYRSLLGESCDQAGACEAESTLTEFFGRLEAMRAEDCLRKSHLYNFDFEAGRE
jgi:hypothetical protein